MIPSLNSRCKWGLGRYLHCLFYLHYTLHIFLVCFLVLSHTALQLLTLAIGYKLNNICFIFYYYIYIALVCPCVLQELECLQDHLDDLGSDCRDVVGNLTELESEVWKTLLFHPFFTFCQAFSTFTVALWILTDIWWCNTVCVVTILCNTLTIFFSLLRIFRLKPF